MLLLQQMKSSHKILLTSPVFLNVDFVSSLARNVNSCLLSDSWLEVQSCHSGHFRSKLCCVVAVSCKSWSRCRMRAVIGDTPSSHLPRQRYLTMKIYTNSWIVWQQNNMQNTKLVITHQCFSNDYYEKFLNYEPTGIINNGSIQTKLLSDMVLAAVDGGRLDPPWTDSCANCWSTLL